MRLALIVLLALSTLLAGCPREKRALNAARKAVEAAAQTVDLVDAEHASLYEAAAEACLEASSTRPEYDACIYKWDKTVLAVSSMKLSLLLVENALDTWEAGSPNGHNNLLSAAGCFTESLLRLQDLLRELDAPTPVLDRGLDYISDIFKGGLVCSNGVTL